MAQFTPEEMNQLRTQRYAGFVQKRVPRIEMRKGGKTQTGYNQVTNYDAYNIGLLGRARDAVGIKKVNNADEIRRIYDFIGGYQEPAPAPAAPAAPAAAPAPLMPTISDAAKKYRAKTDAKLRKIDKKIANFNKSEAAAIKAREIAEQTRVRNFAIQTANQARSGQTANLQIQPASSTPKTAGTQRFKKRKLDQFMSGISGMVNI